MLKKVRVHILTECETYRGSLFSGGVSEAAGAERERTEMTVAARYHDDGTHVTISWNETEASGMEGSGTSVTFSQDAPASVAMRRTGAVKTLLVFERGKRHSAVYQTPVMPFEVTLLTHEVQNALSTEGKLFLDYTVELRGGEPQRTTMHLSLFPDYDRP